MKKAFLFPGQGSQEPHMGEDLYNQSSQARSLFDQAELEVPGLLEACFSENPEQLKQTEFSQPAIFTVSAALWDEVPDRLRQGYVTGHSLGEYAAIYAAGVLDFSDLLRLVKTRSQLMGAASRRVGGGMMAVLGLDFPKIIDLIRESGLDSQLFAANQNSPQQTVLSGTDQALDQFSTVVREYPGIRLARLDVSGPFHSPLLAPVAEDFALSLKSLNFKNPQLPFVSPTSGGLVETGEEIKEFLIKQFVHPVLWTNVVSWLESQGVQAVVEVGPGRVLTGLVRRIAPGISRFNLRTPVELAEIAAKLKS